MPSFVNNVTTTNKNTEITICLGGKKNKWESYNVSRYFYNCVHIYTEESIAELTQTWVTLGFKSIFWLC